MRFAVQSRVYHWDFSNACRGVDQVFRPSENWYSNVSTEVRAFLNYASSSRAKAKDSVRGERDLAWLHDAGSRFLKKRKSRWVDEN